MPAERPIVLSKDELANGIPFVLRLWNAAGARCQWIANLSGDLASQWYQIYRQNDVEAIRLYAAAVFRTLLTDDESQAMMGSVRCVVISTRSPMPEQLVRDMP